LRLQSTPNKTQYFYNAIFTPTNPSVRTKKKIQVKHQPKVESDPKKFIFKIEDNKFTLFTSKPMVLSNPSVAYNVNSPKNYSAHLVNTCSALMYHTVIHCLRTTGSVQVVKMFKLAILKVMNSSLYNNI
jgi:hypothetical protein